VGRPKIGGNYVVGVFGVTVFGNVPLNEALAKFDVEFASATEIFSEEKSLNRLGTDFT
jgi:uncharacterized membrane protein